MADRNAEPLNRSLAWAFGQTLRLAIGTCVVALLLATALSETAAERFATTAYLAAIVAAVSLGAQRLLPAPVEKRSAAPPFPKILAYCAGLVICLNVVAMLVSAPGAEALAFVGGAVLFGIAVLVRCGATSKLRSGLVRGGASAASLLAATRAGSWTRRTYARATARLDALSRALVFKRTTTYAGAIAAAALLAASLIPHFAEPLAVVAYAAAVAGGFGVAMECRRLGS